MNADAPYCDVLLAELKIEARRVALARRAAVDPAGKGDALAAVILRDCPPSSGALVALFRFKIGVITLLGMCAISGLALKLVQPWLA